MRIPFLRGSYLVVKLVPTLPILPPAALDFLVAIVVSEHPCRKQACRKHQYPYDYVQHNKYGIAHVIPFFRYVITS